MEGGEDAESTTTMVVAVEVGGERGRGQMTDRQTDRQGVSAGNRNTGFRYTQRGGATQF